MKRINLVICFFSLVAVNAFGKNIFEDKNAQVSVGKMLSCSQGFATFSLDSIHSSQNYLLNSKTISALQNETWTCDKLKTLTGKKLPASVIITEEYKGLEFGNCSRQTKEHVDVTLPKTNLILSTVDSIFLVPMDLNVCEEHKND